MIHSLYTTSSQQQNTNDTNTTLTTKPTTSIDAICLGSGRFLRAVLVPALVGCGFQPVIFQTRGRTFLDYCIDRSSCDDEQQQQENTITTTAVVNEISYEVDTVLHCSSSDSNNSVQTDTIPIAGVGTLGTSHGKNALFALIRRRTATTTKGGDGDGDDDGTRKIRNLRMIGVGVTEAGLASVDSTPVRDLAELLDCCRIAMYGNDGTGDDTDGDDDRMTCDNPNGKICVINTDNVPGNGSLLQEYMIQIATTTDTQSKRTTTTTNNNNNNNNNNGRTTMTFLQFITDKVSFHNTMVDRITSQREGDGGGMVPRAEPIPAKALVVEDLEGDLPLVFGDVGRMTPFGVVVRTQPQKLKADIALKLRVANGTHTAVAHVMALSLLTTTASLSPPLPNSTNTINNNNNTNDYSKLLMQYLDSLFTHQILPAAQESYGTDETMAAYNDWRGRLIHPNFGLSTFFVTQNGAAKGGIRLGPTVSDLVMGGKNITCATVFALAAILRFVTPAITCTTNTTTTTSKDNGIYRGWLDGFDRPTTKTSTTTAQSNNDNDDDNDDADTDGKVEYADGLSYHSKQGWYEFRCNCLIQPSNPSTGTSTSSTIARSLPQYLATPPYSRDTQQQTNYYEDVIRSYLLKSDGGDLSHLLLPNDGDGDDSTTTTTLDTLIQSIAKIYVRMITNDDALLPLILQEMADGKGIYHPDGLATDHRILLS